MSNSYWKTGEPRTRSIRTPRPSAWQVLRQLGLVALIVVVWSGVFAGYLSVVKPQLPTPIASLRSGAVTRTPRATPAFTPAATVTRLVSAPPDTPIANKTGLVPTPTPTSLPATSTPTPVTPTNAPSANGQPGTVSFAKDVLPIFTSVCVKCHGGEKTEEALVLKTYADVMQGSDNGPVIEPGNSADSLLIDLINQGKMPKKGPRLLPGQIRIITQWVDEGAPNN